MPAHPEITVQRLMDRFHTASRDLFARYFDDDFVADRFMWVEKAMFLVMVLNYFNLSSEKEVYTEIQISPTQGAEAVIQGSDARQISLSGNELLHFCSLLDDDYDKNDGRYVIALFADAEDPAWVGQTVVLEYSDCRFIGSLPVYED